MQRIISLMKTMLQGGLLVVLPTLLFIMLIGQVVSLLVAMVGPIANLISEDFFSHAQFPLILALILLLGASLLVGLAMRSAQARRLGRWIERQTFDRLPMYRFVKTLSGGLLGSDQSYAFKPALLVWEGHQREFVYVIEDHGNGDLTILKPWAPTAFSGSVKIVPKEQVQSMDVSLAEVTMVLNHLGMGAHELIGASKRIRK